MHGRTGTVTLVGRAHFTLQMERNKQEKKNILKKKIKIM
jgi:hypothetical protein